MSKQYTADGKRRSSMTHARRAWTCDCGKTVMGNGGKSGHRRACRGWAAAELARLDYLLENYMDEPVLTDAMRRWSAQRDLLRDRLRDDA